MRSPYKRLLNDCRPSIQGGNHNINKKENIMILQWKERAIRNYKSIDEDNSYAGS